MEDDERLQEMMAFLWGSWNTKQLAQKIAILYQCQNHPDLNDVAQKIANLHTVTGSYTNRDVAEQLERLG